MSLSRTGPLDRRDIYRIINDFDRTRFDSAKSLPKDWLDRVIVIIQFERKLFYFHLPIELIDNIMRRCLEGSPSVRELLLYYKNTPATMLHPLPLSNDTHYINNASKSLLVRLGQASAEGELDSYLQLMSWVFAQYFRKLTLDQKLELIRRSNITPWEQKSTSQKLELFGRIQAPTFLGQAKLNLQFLSWKVRFTAAWALRKHIITLAMRGTIALCLAGLSIWAAGFFSNVAKIAICPALMNGWYKALIYYRILAFATLRASLAFTVIGLALQIGIFLESIQKKGVWLQSVSWNYFFTAFHFFAAIVISLASFPIISTGFLIALLLKFLDSLLPLIVSLINKNSEWEVNASQTLHTLLLQSINTDNIITEQNSFANAHLPDLINQWLNLTLPSDKDTGSLQTLQ